MPRSVELGVTGSMCQVADFAKCFCHQDARTLLIGFPHSNLRRRLIGQRRLRSGQEQGVYVGGVDVGDGD